MTLSAPSLPLASPAADARRGLTIYFVVLIVGSGIFEWLVLRTGDPIGNHGGLIFGLMWMPALASAVARVSLRERIRDVSFRLGGRLGVRALGVAIGGPLLVGGVAYGIAWATGLAGLSVWRPTALPWVAALPSGARFVMLLLISATVGTLFGMLSASGEEIGWRGYMLPRLVAAGVPRPLLVSGLIWASWHLPLILSGQYASGPHPLISAGIFIVDVVGIAVVIGVLRLRTGSVWPAIVFHACWNSVIQGPFDQSSTGPGATVWVGESGILVAVMSLVLAVLIYYRWSETRTS
ncbi:MAG TPA: CPBP family intramembrane glutamic endopeptidase [Gemmatimonadaceae bacterium]|jgi:membrane protease YdiL (CAAX protease family)|nr:CPBP family intramembrane glutamic endopeptidase [Gemmatimonadaceae bacterium]